MQKNQFDVISEMNIIKERLHKVCKSLEKLPEGLKDTIKDALQMERLLEVAEDAKTKLQEKIQAREKWKDWVIVILVALVAAMGGVKLLGMLQVW